MIHSTQQNPQKTGHRYVAGNTTCSSPANTITLRLPLHQTPAPSETTMPSPHSVKQRVLACLNKLSDRDTHSLAIAELESIAGSVDATTLPALLSSVLATDASDKTLVRKHCVQLLEFLAETHGNALSPYLSKILIAVVRRIRDQESTVRSACADSVAALSRHVSKQPFFSSFAKPLSEALFTEQDANVQSGVALCLAAAIDGAPDPEPARLAKLLPKFEKLLKRRDAFRAKPAVLALIASVVSAGCASSQAVLKNLVPCLVESLSSEDWAARKAAAEALAVLADVERDSLSEFKAGCIEVFENRRFDKVKLVREVINQMMEAWKQVPDVSDDFSPPPQSQSSSKEDASDGRYPPFAQSSCSPHSVMENLRKKSTSASRFTPPDSSSAGNAKTNNPSSVNKQASLAASRKLNHKNWGVQIALSNNAPYAVMADHADLEEMDETFSDRSRKDRSRLSKPDINQALFCKNPDEKMLKFVGSKAGSRVAPYHEETQDSVPDSNVSKDPLENDKESEELSLIRDQLQQIEKQQSSLFDLLQNFIGSSTNGMRALETRVHGLELTLDEISCGLAISSGRMTNSAAHGNTCCLLPGAEFWSPKFWRKPHGWCSSSRLSRSGATPLHRNAKTKLTSQRVRLDGGFITNPLAEVHTNLRDFARSQPV